MFQFEDGTLKKGAYVVIDGVEYEVHMPEYEGETPLTAENLNRQAKDVEEKINEIKKCNVTEESEKGMYVKLFTVTNAAAYKSFNVLFWLNDTQNLNYNQLCNLTVHYGVDTINIVDFKTIPFYRNVTTNIFAVITNSTTVEVYLQMGAGQSPTIQVLSSTRLREEDVYGKLEIDMNTVVTNLPAAAIKATDRDVLFEGKLYSRQSIALDMQKYSYLLITYVCFPYADDHNSGINNVMLMDLTTKVDNRSVYTCANSVPYNIFASDYGNLTSHMGIGCTVNSKKSDLKVVFEYNNGIIADDNTNYYISKIVGIL